MSKKKKQSSASGTYALCITIGLIVGIGIVPLTGSPLFMILAGGLVGAAIAYVIIKKAPKPQRRHHH